MRRTDRWLLALLAIVLAYNLPQLAIGSVQFDAVDVHYAAQRYLSEEVHAARLPFWTPYIFSGFPFLADLQVGAWYPLNWPFFAIGITPRSIGAEIALHELIAASGAYLLSVRLLRGGGIAGLTAGLLYSLSGWFAAHAQHVGMVATAAWLPWLVLLLDCLRERVSLRRLAIAGALGAAIALPGSFQIALYTFTFVALWAAVDAIAQRSWPVAGRLAIGLAAAIGWGALLSAVMILPTLELVGQSERRRLNALQLPDIGYFHPRSLLTLVDPNYYGLLSGPYIGPGDSTQHYFYAGILAVPLALLGVQSLHILRTAAVLSLPFLWYALGPVGGLYWLVARVPGFSNVELPMHGWFLPALGLALLGGAGMLRVERRIGRHWSGGLVGVLLLDVLVVNQLLNPLAFARASFDALYGAALAQFDAQVAAAQPPVQRLHAAEQTAVGYRNHALQSRVETTYGYNPLELASYADYVAAASDNPRLIAGLAASHTLVDGELRSNPEALPLAYVARSVTQVADERAALADVDPSATTLVDEPLSVQGDPSATVTVTGRGMDWLTLRYASSSTNLIRVAVPFFPGWQATMDDAPLRVVQVDGTFIGIVVPPGSGQLRLGYAPRFFWIGAAISGLTLLATAAAARRRTRAATGRPSL